MHPKLLTEQLSEYLLPKLRTDKSAIDHPVYLCSYHSQSIIITECRSIDLSINRCSQLISNGQAVLVSHSQSNFHPNDFCSQLGAVPFSELRA